MLNPDQYSISMMLCEWLCGMALQGQAAAAEPDLLSFHTIARGFADNGGLEVARRGTASCGASFYLNE